MGFAVTFLLTFKLATNGNLNVEVVTAVTIWDDGNTNILTDETAEHFGIRPVDVVCGFHTDDEYR